MNKTVALIMAGGQGNRLSILSEERAKPALPFAGKYRLIDFALSNCVNSGIARVGVLTQYRPSSLNEHVGAGRPWELDRDRGGLLLLQPYRGRRSGDWYKGTADAIYQNLPLLDEWGAQTVLVLSGDHVYKMRYDEMVAYHQAREADVTLGVMEVPWEEASRFGLVVTDQDDQVLAFEEKPARPKARLASMGVYLFEPRVLKEVLEEDASSRGSTRDFGHDVLPAMLGRYRVLAYRFSGYWRDVGTVESYWKANMDFLEEPPPLILDSGDNPVRTRPYDRPPARLGRSAVVQQSLLCHGTVIQGTVLHSVLSRGVVVEEGAVVQDSILFDDVVVRRGATISTAVVDKEVVLGEEAAVGYGEDNTPNADEPDALNTGITVVGKRAVVPGGARIGRNCRIMPGVRESDYPPSHLVPSGSTVERTTRRPAAERVPAH
ncbi:MAG: glucose-1-phosphate adenylyltransferase [Chloroflexi bacterium]|nr:glucose-1-phosphate adenylyltransferase [Chloroflexota bacterium]